MFTKNVFKKCFLDSSPNIITTTSASRVFSGLQLLICPFMNIKVSQALIYFMFLHFQVQKISFEFKSTIMQLLQNATKMQILQKLVAELFWNGNHARIIQISDIRASLELG